MSNRTIAAAYYETLEPKSIPMIIDEGTAETIDAGAKLGGTAANGVGIGSLLVSILLGGSLEQLWGLLNTL